MVSVDVLYRWSGRRLRRFLDAMVAIAALALIGIGAAAAVGRFERRLGK